MTRCYLCQKEMGLLDKKIHKVTEGEKIVLCKSCSTVWNEEEKRRVISKLYKDSEPKLLFTFPHVSTWYREEDINIGHFGHLLFTDKGVCFLDVLTHKHGKGPNLGYFGLAGAVIEEAMKSGKKKTVAEAFETTSTGLETGTPQSLRTALEKANRILFIPREKIRSIGHPNLFSEIMIKTIGKRETWECFQGISKETYKHFEDQINEYLKT